MAYSFKVYNSDESELWEVPFESIRIEEELNKGLDGQLTVPFQTIKQYADAFNTTPDGIIASGYRSWKLYKDTDLLYQGVLSERQISGGQSGATTYNIYFTDYVGFLSTFYTAEAAIYSNQDSSDIAWDLIDDRQNDAGGNGDIGITRGADPTTKNRDRTFRRESVLNAIVGMSRAKVADGFDFDIDNSLQFNIYYPQKGTQRPEIVLDSFNIISWTSNRRLASKLVNRVHVIGAGAGEDLITQTRENTTPQSTWGLLEGSLSEKSVSTSSELQDRGDRYLEQNATPTDKVSVRIRDDSPDIRTYQLGDSLTVKLEELSYSELLRVESRNIEIKPDGQAIINLTFGDRSANEDAIEIIREQQRQIADLQRFAG